VAYGYTLNINLKQKQNQIEKINMFNQQEFNLFQEGDALSLEWDFIENNKEIKVEEEKSAKIIVKMNQDTKMISLYKSTLTMEYSLAELKRKIIQEFRITKDMNLKIFFDRKRIMVTNDLVLKQILEFLKEKPMEIEVVLTESKHCLLCMSSDCYHTSKGQNAEKKRKIGKSGINFLEPEKNMNQEKSSHSSLSFSSKKRKTASSCTQILKDSQDLLIPKIGSFIF